MNRIAKLLCCVVLLALSFLLVAETPRAEAYPHCTLDEIEACNEYCASRGMTGTCIFHDQCHCAR